MLEPVAGPGVRQVLLRQDAEHEQDRAGQRVEGEADGARKPVREHRALLARTGASL